MDGVGQQLLQVLQSALMVAPAKVLNLIFGHILGNLTMFFRPMSHHLPPVRVIGHLRVSIGLARKQILDREDFVEQLELLLCSLFVINTDGHAIELYMHSYSIGNTY
jgi:hypothetical protein